MKILIKSWISGTHLQNHLKLLKYKLLKYKLLKYKLLKYKLLKYKLLKYKLLKYKFLRYKLSIITKSNHNKREFYEKYFQRLPF